MLQWFNQGHSAENPMYSILKFVNGVSDKHGQEETDVLRNAVLFKDIHLGHRSLRFDFFLIL